MSWRMRSCIWQGIPLGFMKKTRRGLGAGACWAWLAATRRAAGSAARVGAPAGAKEAAAATARAARRTSFMRDSRGEGAFGRVGARLSAKDSAGAALGAGREPSVSESEQGPAERRVGPRRLRRRGGAACPALCQVVEHPLDVLVLLQRVDELEDLLR